MTQESNLSTLSAWWDNTNFDHKNLYTLNEQGELILKEYQDYKARTVGTLNPENPDLVFKLLVEKFPEIEAKVTELVAEWDAEQDKLKLIGKVERMKEYLHHTNAAGDFHTIYKIVENLDKEVHKLAQENFVKKQELVVKAEQLTNSEEWKETTEELKKLAEEWKAIGYVEKERNDGLWTRLEAAKDKFFERKRNHQEDVNKEMLQNLDLKMELVEKAEQLAASDDWKKATDEFKDLMDKWKGIGRTMHDKNEELWKRFTEANNVFFERKKAHFDVIHKEQEDNYTAKLALVERAEALQENTEWNETTQEYNNLMDEWKKLGRVPKEKSDEVWNKFNAARDVFFNRKRENFESLKLSQEDNYAQKMALLKRAEALQNSTQWREATDELNELMTEWKKIGAVPRKHSEEIWQRFLAARKNFFDRKDANREKRKHIYEKKEHERVQHTKGFVGKIADELKEEEEKLEDFKQGLQNITPGMKKEAELRDHLEKLIAQTEQRISHKKEKLEDAKKQLEAIESKENSNG